MSSLLQQLPAPEREYTVRDDSFQGRRGGLVASSQGGATVVPPYGQRQGFAPRAPADFGDGGAFPEIAMTQYPLNMGREGEGGRGSGNGNTMMVPVDDEGNARHDAVVTMRRGVEVQRVHSRFTDLVEKDTAKLDLSKPSQEEVDKTTQETKALLDSIVASKSAADKSVQLPKQSQERHKVSQFTRYTPAQDAPGFNPNAKQRIIRTMEMPKDPLEPPKFKHKKVPGGPGEAPVPVMHAPAEKLSAKDQQAWKIPPCVSNWKNSQGYTIPLDKRLAADGRSLLEPTINDKFASFTEALYIAERKAREEVEHHAALRKRLAKKEKDKKEQELRALAAQKRAERAGLGAMGATAAAAAGFDAGNGAQPEPLDEPRDAMEAARAAAAALRRGDRDRPGAAAAASAAADTGGEQGFAAREAARQERRRELQREVRMDKRRGGDRSDADRDISERIALGTFRASTQRTGEAQFDSRLFNQDQGMSNALSAPEDADIAYDSRLKLGASSASIYRPTAASAQASAEEQLAALRNSERFRPDRDFEGVARGGAARSGPVQFERAADATAGAKEGDVFGMDAMFGEEEAKEASTLGRIGKSGQMAASAGGGRSSGAAGPGGRSLAFE